MPRFRAVRGFTLIEIVIVIALMGILTMVAASSYSGFVQDARRADGVAVLLETRQAMERYFAKNFTYVGAEPDVDFPAKSPKDGNDRFYTITVTATAEDFSILATAVGVQVDDDCLNLGLTRLGQFSNSAGLDNHECFE